VTATRVTRRWGRRRLALGLSPTSGAGLALLLAGVAIGPRGLGVLSATTLGSLDPLVSLALASLGVLVGLDLRLGGRQEWRLLGAGSLEAGVTIGVVALGSQLAAAAVPALFSQTWPLSVMLGLCAASSSTVAEHDDLQPHSARVHDLDDILPIVLAGLIAVWTRASAPPAFAWLLLQTALMAALLASATVLLLRQTAAETEQRVFALGAVLLLGGIAAHLSLSALAGGLFAGVLWNVAGGAEREHIARDLRYLQHPLMVLLLIVAGAGWMPSPALLALLLLYVALRSAGKLLGHRLSQRLTSSSRPARWSAWHLTSPGVVGLAIAVESMQISNQPYAATVLSVIVAGALVFDLLSRLVAREGATR
jgi:hypothetical protein